jgi:hypothetical protein
VFEDGEVTLLLSLNAFSSPLSGEQIAALGARLVSACVTVTKSLG